MKSYSETKLATVLSVSFYSNPKATDIQWYLLGEAISNSTKIIQDVIDTNVELFMFGRSVNVKGYASNITLHQPKSGSYTVIIENAYGQTKTVFNLELTITG